MIEKPGDVVLRPFQPQKLADAARPEDVVPHQSRIRERVEPDKASIARKRFLAGKNRVPRSKEVNQSASGQAHSKLRGRLVKGFIVSARRFFDQGANAMKIIVSHIGFVL
jgi:hypothetical protein